MIEDDYDPTKNQFFKKEDIEKCVEMSSHIDQLESKISLHEDIEIIYVVDGFEATYYVNDGRFFCKAHGKTILEALANLNKVATKPARRK